MGWLLDHRAGASSAGEGGIVIESPTHMLSWTNEHDGTVLYTATCGYDKGKRSEFTAIWKFVTCDACREFAAEIARAAGWVVTRKTSTL